MRSEIFEKLKKYKPKIENIPFEMDIYFKSPVYIGHRYIHLDSIVLAGLVRKLLGKEYALLPPYTRWAPDFLNDKLPLSKKEFKDGFFYHASIGLPEGKIEFDEEELGIGFFNRKPEIDFERVKRRPRKFQLGSGPYRMFHVAHPILAIKFMKFYGKGNPKEVYECIKNLVGIGKKVNMGFGWIKKIEIREIEKDYSIVRNGISMRYIPVEMVKNPKFYYPYPLIPPYFSKKFLTECVPPGIQVKIKNGYL